MTGNSEKTERIVIVGGGYAGVMAAIRLSRRTRRLPVSITLVNSQMNFVERIRNHQVATGQRLRSFSIPHLLRGTGVTFMQGTVTALDPARNQVSVLQDGVPQPLPYDRLIYALGSMTDVARVPGVAAHAFTMDRASAAALHERLQGLGAGQRILVVGGRLTAIETSTELAESYPTLKVNLTTSGTLGSDLSAAGQAYLRKVSHELGITIHDQATVTNLDENIAHFADGASVQFDVCVWAGGFTVSPLARQAGLAVNPEGQILIDPTLRSVSHPDVYAVGDAAAFSSDCNLSLRKACATAMPMAVHAADNLAKEFRDIQPEPFAFGYLIRCISLGRRHGLVQMVQPDDTPKPQIITGWTGALVKEIICQVTTWALRLERRWTGAYYWPKAISAARSRSASSSKIITARS